MSKFVKKNLEKPDETRSFPKGKVEVILFDGGSIAKATFQPGWRWTEVMPPIVKTDTCQATHNHVILSGTMHVRMNDGTETEFGPGDAGLVQPGHDAWVVGNEPVVMLDFNGMTHYAEQK